MLGKWLGPYKDWGMLPLRLALAWIFIAHGGQKLFGAFGGGGLSGTAGFFGQMGIQPALFWAIVVALVEFFGGVLTLIGLFTRWVGVLLSINMLVAIATVHASKGFFVSNGGYEFNVALMGMSIALILTGAGKLSVESAMKRSE